MWGEWGHLALWLALACSLWLGSFVLLPPGLGHHRLLRRGSIGLCALLFSSLAALAAAFVTHDFSLNYVAQHSNRLLPLAYRLTAVWGGHEGSLLLWLWILSLWTAAVAWRLPREMEALHLAFYQKVLGVLALLQFGFMVFILSSSNPFQRSLPMPFDGQDLNPLLQDPGLIFHPPLLYGGYVGFAVAFAFVVAALWLGRLERRWLQFLRPWVLAAWITLTLGIALGSYWAYYELGWGGWWFWDPVENASFMPWLIGSALIHSLLMSERRGLLQIWTCSLAILAFALSLIGTFLVRSGVLTSVHAFASDPTRGVAILILLAVITFPAVLLLLFRAHRLQPRRHYQWLSRDGALLLNNWLFSGAFLVVFIGTLYPLLLDVLDWGKISVGAPYFNRFMVPLASLSLLLLGLAPLLRWQRERWPRLQNILLFLLPSSLLLSAWLLGRLPFFSWPFYGMLSLICWVLLSIALDYGLRWYRGRWRQTQQLCGMWLAHSGYALMIFGMAATGWFSQEYDRSMKMGDSLNIAGHEVQLLALEAIEGANYRSTQGFFMLQREDELLAILKPEKRQYFSSTMPLSESARHVSLARDIYLAMGEEIQSDVWAVRLQYKPFIIWIWLGALWMCLGSFLAARARRGGAT